MSLKCAGCDTPIPPGASKCPMCGATVQYYQPATANEPPRKTVAPPIVQTVTEIHHHHHVSQPDKPVLIEATAKKWKKLYLYACLFFFLGFTSCIGGASDQSSGAMTFGSICMLVAIGLYIRARFGAWWHHG